jgi:hypothetical protein
VKKSKRGCLPFDGLRIPAGANSIVRDDYCHEIAGQWRKGKGEKKAPKYPERQISKKEASRVYLVSFLKITHSSFL